MSPNSGTSEYHSLLSILYDSNCLLHHVDMPRIRMQSISKTFADGTQALRSVSLEVKNGELIALVGPSGCGKTTLLRIIAGLETPSSGELLFDEEEVTTLDPDRRDLGMVFQNYALFPHLSVLRNIMLGMENSSLSKTEKIDEVNSVAENLGLSNFLERKPAELSGGQRQRVALARLLVRNPSIHLLDEPLSNLDANLRLKMREELADLHRKHQKTTLFVTHDQVEAMTLGERICLLNEGKIEQIGSPWELYNSPKNLFVAKFFGMPSINLMPGSILQQSDRQESIFVCGNSSLKFHLPFPLETDRKEIILGIRPENIIPQNDSTESTFQIHRKEFLGDSIVSYLSFEDKIIVCKQAEMNLQSGEETGIAIDWSSVHWFNPEDGERIQ